MQYQDDGIKNTEKAMEVTIDKYMFLLRNLFLQSSESVVS